MGAAVLLQSIGTPAALAVAAKLSEQAETDAGARQEVILTRRGEVRLLGAPTELAEHVLPERVRVLKGEPQRNSAAEPIVERIRLPRQVDFARPSRGRVATSSTLRQHGRDPAGSVGEERVVLPAANEVIERDTSAWSDPDVICECSRAGCIERVEVTHEEYEHVRSEGTRFLVVPGHENPSVEKVVERHPTYLVVEKTGAAGNYADQHDPRETDS